MMRMSELHVVDRHWIRSCCLINCTKFVDHSTVPTNPITSKDPVAIAASFRHDGSSDTHVSLQRTSSVSACTQEYSHSSMRVTTTAMTTMDSTMKKNKRKGPVTFPWWCLIIAYILSYLAIGVSILFIIARGIEFGDEKTQKWLTSILTGFFSSIIITEPIKVSHTSPSLSHTFTLSLHVRDRFCVWLSSLLVSVVNSTKMIHKKTS